MNKNELWPIFTLQGTQILTLHMFFLLCFKAYDTKTSSLVDVFKIFCQGTTNGQLRQPDVTSLLSIFVVTLKLRSNGSIVITLKLGSNQIIQNFIIALESSHRRNEKNPTYRSQESAGRRHGLQLSRRQNELQV